MSRNSIEASEKKNFREDMQLASVGEQPEEQSEDQSWKKTKDWLCEINPGEVFPFCRKFFAEKDLEFVRAHEVADLLDDECLQDWCETLLCEDNRALSAFLEVLLEALLETGSRKSLDKWCRYVKQGNKITESYPSLQKGLNRLVREHADQVDQFLNVCIEKDIEVSDIFKGAEGLGCEMNAELFIVTGEKDYFQEEKDWQAVIDWLLGQKKNFIASFIGKCNALKGREEMVGVDRFIQQLLRDDRMPAVQNTTGTASNFYPIVESEWKKLQQRLSYVVFDLESDGKRVSEFAFCSGDEVQTYTENAESSLDFLFEQINSCAIVVGHRIRQWDLEILKKYGNVTPQFVWDTLEMEILLDPCRQAYSLDTKHHAEADVELTKRLFWNQLLRLSQDMDLCTQLKDFLQECKGLNSILEDLRKPVFSNFIKSQIAAEKNFFQGQKEMDSVFKSKIEAIGKVKDQSVLIVAPKQLWNRIAKLVPVSFIDDGIEYKRISENKLDQISLAGFQKLVLKRYCRLSKNPIVASLASYLRIQYFDDELLKNCVAENSADIKCADIRYAMNLGKDSEFARIYLVGCELEDKLNQFSLKTPLKLSEFWVKNSSILMRLGGTGFTFVTPDERLSPLFAKVPENASHVWIERNQKGSYEVKYNYEIDLESLIGKLKSMVPDVEEIPWNLSHVEPAVSLVRSGSPVGCTNSGKFDFARMRVNATARDRAMYWVYQLALLKDLPCSGMPIIYILEDDLELDQVIQYARSLEFYVPEGGSLISSLDKIAHGSHGLVVITRNQFFKIIGMRLPTAYCYVWDQMAVEKNRLMWQEEDSQSTLMSLWPVYQYYSRLALTNESRSIMYVLESALDEQYFLGSSLNAKIRESGELWQSEQEYRSSYEHARTFFKESSKVADPFYRLDDAARIKIAMDEILSTLVPERAGKRSWTSQQEAVLPAILSRKENYLVSIPTGGGKSVLFQGPALYLASHTHRLSLVVTPLKALMQDQVEELAEKGFVGNVDYLNSDRTYQETKNIYRKICGGDLALLYVTPERFRSSAFMDALMARIVRDGGLEYMIFDEAHCISQWGFEFRPEYLNVIKKYQELDEELRKNICVLMLSATVTEMIYDQINQMIPVTRLGESQSSPIGKHIGISFQKVAHDFDSRIPALVTYITSQRINFKLSRMLVFCKTREMCEDLARILPSLLVEKHILNEEDASRRVGFFHAGLDSTARNQTYDRFKSDQDPVYILCATKAFGMGMDIPNIHYVFHMYPPSVLEDYLQEVGRAGRNIAMREAVGFSDKNPIPAVCLYSDKDIDKYRDKLLKDSLCWKNLEDIRTAIMDYISTIQPLEDTKKIPVVIPNTLWTHSAFDYEHTDFKLGEYWLERLGRIKMRFLAPSHIVICLKRNDVPSGSGFPYTESDLTIQVFRYLTNVSESDSQEFTNPKFMQVSLTELERYFSASLHEILDALIRCQDADLLAISQSVECRVANTRRDEVRYILNESSENVAFEIILDAVEEILDEIGPIGKEVALCDEQVCRHIHMDFRTDSYKYVGGAGENQETRCYMKWYNEKDPDRNKGLSIKEQYEKDLKEKRFKQVFFVLSDIVPDVKCRSVLGGDGNAFTHLVQVDSDAWKTFLIDFRTDCLAMLKRINDLTESNNTDFYWAQAMIDLNLADKGFSYFKNILDFLSGMAYITIDNLFPMGIEVFTTANSKTKITENSDSSIKRAFDDAISIRNLRLCVMDVLTNKIQKNVYDKFIKDYFSKKDQSGFMMLLDKYCDESDPVFDIIRETALKAAEAKLNSAQREIYNYDAEKNINVEAGPGTGKTHILAMRCVKLIYYYHIAPDQILVLAYNRAVVSELKSRLRELFASLGFGSSVRSLNVHTFHGLIKKIYTGDEDFEKLDMSKWESFFLENLKNNDKIWRVNDVLHGIRYILIDEFQDINHTRLNTLLEMNRIYNHPVFFIIGDKNQSIYGYDKQGEIDPQTYYDDLKKALHFDRMTMTINYRSYPAILEAAKRILGDKAADLQACKNNIVAEPDYDYTEIYDNGECWYEDFEDKISDLQEKGIKDVAIFFRTNAELYEGYSRIKDLPVNARIRIQGTSEAALFRKREIYELIHLLETEGQTEIILENDETKLYIKGIVEDWIETYGNWDSFYLDFGYTVVLEYLNEIAGDEQRHTYEEMAEYLKTILSEDNGPLYKLYDKYADQRILEGDQMNIILTTVHKVKGLEFDAVIVTPSVVSLPYDPKKEVDMSKPLSDYDTQCIMEEKRLLYVAYTRARKHLIAYLGEREKAVQACVKYKGDEQILGIQESNVMGVYNIGFNVSSSKVDEIQEFIETKLSINDSITIKKDSRSNKYKIVSDNHIVGELTSNKSHIAKAMKARKLSELNGYYVSEVFCWSYKDSQLADEKSSDTDSPTKYAAGWSAEAKKRGYVAVVGINGCGKEQ